MRHLFGEVLCADWTYADPLCFYFVFCADFLVGSAEFPLWMCTGVKASSTHLLLSGQC